MPTLEEAAARCEQIEKDLHNLYHTAANARNDIYRLEKERNALWQKAIEPWVGKTFKRGMYYAILSDVPQEQVFKSGTSFNVQQLPAMIFVYSPEKNIDVRKHPEEMGLMWPDTLFRGEMPDEYNTQGAHNTLDKEKWVEIPTSEWIDAFEKRIYQVRIDLLRPVTPAL